MKEKKFWVFNLLQKVHIYGGLYLFPFFIVIGLSAIQLHDHFFEDDVWISKEHNYNLNFDTSLSEDSLSIALKDSLKIYGYDPYWKRWYDDSGKYHFKIERPGRIYNFIVNKETKDIAVEEQYTGIFSVMVGLHLGAQYNPNSILLKIWKVYRETAFVVLFLILAISVYFWFQKSIHSRLEWIIIIVSTLFLISYFLYLWHVG